MVQLRKPLEVVPGEWTFLVAKAVPTSDSLESVMNARLAMTVSCRGLNAPRTEGETVLSVRPNAATLVGIFSRCAVEIQQPEVI